MARILSATLEEQQKLGLASYPYLIAKIRRKWGGVIRYEWENLYEGAEMDGPHTAAMPDDGSLVRLRIDEDDADKLYYQRIADPTDPGADFSAWTYLSKYDIDVCASCAYGTNVFQCYIDGARKLYYRESSDSGASWGSWALLTYAPSTGYHALGVAYKSNGDICLLYIDQDTLSLYRRVATVWQAKSDCPNTLENPSGVAVHHYEDWNIIVTTGQGTDGCFVLSCIYGEGERQAAQTWSDWENIIERNTTEPYEYFAPFVARPDTTRLYFVEHFTQSEEKYRMFYTHMPPSAHFDECAWLEPVPMELEEENGLDICVCGAGAWLTNALKVYSASTADDEFDISDKLLVVDITQYPDIRKGRVQITVDNTAGVFSDFARMGDEVTIGIGYRTPAGYEYSLTSSFWITKYKLVSPSWSIWRSLYPFGILGTLTIEGQDAWDFLKRYKTRRPYSWAEGEKSVKWLLRYFFARAGLDFVVDSESDAVQNFEPEFERGKGAKFSTIIKALLKMVPDQVFFREAEVRLRNPTTADAVDWEYHNILGTALLVYRGKYGTSAQDPNRVEVWGDTFMKEGADWPQLNRMRDRLSYVTNPTYPDLTRAGERVDAELRKAEIMTSEESWMQTPTNCGLEPWDKLQITDQISGVTDIIRRAIRIKTHWDAKQWAYHQIITMGAD